MSKEKLIVILGPTATGKTNLAVALAHKLGGEIISADSRQVYRGMTIGTGKDLKDYHCCQRDIPYHLIDIVNPGYEYNVFEFQKDFIAAYNDVTNRGKIPILCGGTGMYLDAILKKYHLHKVPTNIELRNLLEKNSAIELTHILEQYKTPHNTTDSLSRERLIRAIEIADYNSKHHDTFTFPEFDSVVFGISLDRSIVREKISLRLKERLEQGMIEEVKELLQTYTSKQIMFYGLEYKFVTRYLIGEISREEMEKKLEIAIHQFAKRQMTWFRRMERNGTTINWIDGELSKEEKLKKAISILGYPTSE